MRACSFFLLAALLALLAVTSAPAPAQAQSYINTTCLTTYFACGTCVAAGCSWCGTVVDGSGSTTGVCGYSLTVCPTTSGYYWTNTQAGCSANGGGTIVTQSPSGGSYTGAGGSDGGSTSSDSAGGFGTTSSGNSKFTPTPTTDGGKAAFPLLWIVFAVTIAALAMCACLPIFKPVAGARVATPQIWAITQHWHWVAISAHIVAFILLLSSAATDSYTNARSSYAYSYAQVDFGVVSARSTAFLGSLRASYDCTDSGLTSAQKSVCVSFQIGGIFTLIYSIANLFFLLITFWFAMQARRIGMIVHPKLFAFTMVSFFFSLATLFGWALSCHLIIAEVYKPANTGGAGVTVSLGASWGLLFPIMLLQAFLAIYYRARIENTPKEGNPNLAVGGLSTGIGFSGVVLVPGQPVVYAQQPMQGQPMMQQQQGQPMVYAQQGQPMMQGQPMQQQQQQQQQGQPMYTQQGPPMQQQQSPPPQQGGYPQQQYAPAPQQGGPQMQQAPPAQPYAPGAAMAQGPPPPTSPQAEGAVTQ